jgi:hypothetical protein
MSGKYTSPFDDLLASNQQQINDVMGGPSKAFATQTSTSSSAGTPPPQQTSSQSGTTDSSVINGTADGIPFSLKI